MDDERTTELFEDVDYESFWDADSTEDEDTEDAPDEETPEGSEESELDESEDVPPAEADQPDAEEVQEPVAETEEQEAQPEADQLFELKHLDDTRTVSRDEVVVLAQKGLDYDRIRTKLDEATTAGAENAELVTSITELAKDSGMSLADFIDTSAATLLAKKEGLDPAEALSRIRLARKERELSARETKLAETEKHASQVEKKQAEEEARRQADVQEFIEAYKDNPVDFKTIPQSVWADVRKGATLTAAYMKYENQQLKAQLAAAEAEVKAKEQSSKNASRSTGSRATVSTTEKERTDWWYEDDE